MHTTLVSSFSVVPDPGPCRFSILVTNYTLVLSFMELKLDWGLCCPWGFSSPPLWFLVSFTPLVVLLVMGWLGAPKMTAFVTG